MQYFYNHQFHKHIIQFMEIFRGYQIQTGKGADGTTKFIDVPVSYGSKDRVTAAILNNNTQNLPLRLPTMIANLRGISLATDRFKGSNTVRKVNYVPRGHIFPDDITTVVQMAPVPYMLNMDLIVYTSNIDTHLQLLEQILVLFNPSVQIQLSDSDFDMGSISTVELKDVNMEEAFPVGTSRRMTITTLSFEVIAYLSIPSQLRDEAIKNIYVRIGAVNDLSSNDSILSSLDSQLEQYVLIVNAADEINKL
jgi:hypothetical protein